MYQILPDPNPGRCLNHRTVYGESITSVRCLEYEDTEHVCRFPEVPVASPTSHSYSTTVKQPEPWVRPENAMRLKNDGSRIEVRGA